MCDIPNDTAAIWSAIAASFAALSSFLIMLIQRRTLLESVRPELVLTGWDRKTEGTGDVQRDVIIFKKVKNVGRGVAFHVNTFSLTQLVQNKPTVMMSNIRLPLLAVNEESDVDGRIMVWWDNVVGEQYGFKRVPVQITLLSWDSRGRRHETIYSIMVIALCGQTLVADEIAPGVMYSSRRTTIRPVWLLKLKRAIGKIPLLGRPFSDKVA